MLSSQPWQSIIRSNCQKGARLLNCYQKREEKPSMR
jgi:hypothetical protein